MNIRNSFTTLALTGAILLSSAGIVNAAGSQCQIIYGGGEVCQDQIKFSLDKKVNQPTKGGGYVDNLGANDAHFQPGADVAFQITVTNTGDKTIEQLNVVDTLPSYLKFVSGAGTYNASNNTVSYAVNNLPAGSSNQQTFVTKIVDKATLPQNQGVVCLNNNVSAHDNKGNSAKDNAGLCVENSIVAVTPTPVIYSKVPVKNIPNTGPELLPMLGLIPAGIAGLLLRKKSKLD